MSSSMNTLANQIARDTRGSSSPLFEPRTSGQPSEPPEMVNKKRPRKGEDADTRSAKRKRSSAASPSALDDDDDDDDEIVEVERPGGARNLHEYHTLQEMIDKHQTITIFVGQAPFAEFHPHVQHIATSSQRLVTKILRSIRRGEACEVRYPEYSKQAFSIYDYWLPYRQAYRRPLLDGAAPSIQEANELLEAYKFARTEVQDIKLANCIMDALLDWTEHAFESEEALVAKLIVQWAIKEYSPTRGKKVFPEIQKFILHTAANLNDSTLLFNHRSAIAKGVFWQDFGVFKIDFKYKGSQVSERIKYKGGQKVCLADTCELHAYKATMSCWKENATLESNIWPQGWQTVITID